MKSDKILKQIPGVLFLGCAVFAMLTLNACEQEEIKVTQPPAEVTVVTVEAQTVPQRTQFVAQVASSHEVEILARVSGFLDKILYKEGDVVRAGQVMFQIDPKPFQAQVDAAQGAVQNRQAQLWTAQANLARIKPLSELDAASQSDLDNATGAVKSAAADLASAQARLEEAKLNLGYTTIHAPVTGVSGQAYYREGSYLAAGTSGKLSYVAQIDPIWVNFSISQNQLSQRSQEIAEGRLQPPADDQYQVEIELSDGSIFPYTGTLNFISPTFNQDTGSFLARAQIPNPKGVLRPGMFVKATVSGSMRPNTLMVPQKAVQETANGHVVYVATPEGVAEIRPVMVGQWVGDNWIITQGLKAGENVIVDGFQRLAPGAPVKAVTAPPPASKDMPQAEKEVPSADKEAAAAPAGK
jgi:membrane fusion protein (multidrug efflux system)